MKRNLFVTLLTFSILLFSAGPTVGQNEPETMQASGVSELGDAVFTTKLISAWAQGHRADVPSIAPLMLSENAGQLDDGSRFHARASNHTIWLPDDTLKTDYITVGVTPGIWHVATDGSDATGDGSQAKPFATIQHGIDVANEGDEIHIAAGTYTDVSDRPFVAEVAYISKTVTLRGGYTTTNWMVPDPEANLTVLNPAIERSRVLFIEGTIDVTVEGLQITGGHAEGYGDRSAGGGVYVRDATVTFRDNVFTDNYVSSIYVDPPDPGGRGGGLYLQNSSATLIGNTFINNSGGYGGGVYQLNGDVVLSDNMFKNNTADVGGGLHLNGSALLNGNTIISNTTTSEGGGLSHWNGTTTLNGNTVSSNTVIFDNRTTIGGGLDLWNVTATLNGNTIFGNSVSCSTIGWGGGLSLYDSIATLSSNTISGNTVSCSVEGWGGGLSLLGSTATLSSNIISGNIISSDAVGWGAGLAHHNGTVTLNSNIISSNIISSAAESWGGGLELWNVVATLNGNTVSGNIMSSDADDWGGGLDLWNVTATLNSNIVSGNIADWGGGLSLEANSTVTLTNDVVIDNRSHDGGSGLFIDSGANTRLLHLTIARNSGGDGSGVHVTGAGSSVSSAAMTNTILVSHSVGITVSAGNTATLEATLWGNGFWANDMDWSGAGKIVTGTINVWDDPDFIDPDARNYHIGRDSAAINAGVDAGVTADIDGQPRPWGAAPDLGADEFSGNHAPVTPHDPNPVDGGTDAPRSQLLEWQGGDPDGDPVTYTVAFGTDTPPPLVAAGVTITSYDPGSLATSTTYYWTITATDGISIAVGPTWTFTTTTSGLPFTGYISKTVIPTHTVRYGDELTYTLSISAPPGTEIKLFDPLSGTTFIRFVQQPAGMVHSEGVITGALVVTPTNRITVSFVTEVNIPDTPGVMVDVSNRACIIPFDETLSSCIWSNEVTNSAYKPTKIFLPIVLSNR